MEMALYGPGGFFTTGRGAGRRADFLTSPEVGPLFGAVLSRALDVEWERLGRPDPFVVVEVGAGRGALARAVLGSEPAAEGALRYVCVERSPLLRAEVEARLPCEPAAFVLGSAQRGDGDDAAPATSGAGPVVAVLDDVPVGPVTGVVVANELLDNLPFRLLERHERGWAEVLVGQAEPGADDLRQFAEIIVDAPADLAVEGERLAPVAAPGARIPVQRAADRWLRRSLELLQRGRLVVIDYADTTASLARRPWRQWIRTYRGQDRGGHPLDDPGGQDITCEVALDQLATVRRPDADRSQAVWLRRHGIDELVGVARTTWRERAHLGDLTALAARSRVGEGDALLDPAGLGAFRVLEWELGR